MCMYVFHIHVCTCTCTVYYVGEVSPTLMTCAGFQGSRWSVWHQQNTRYLWLHQVWPLSQQVHVYIHWVLRLWCIHEYLTCVFYEHHLPQTSCACSNTYDDIVRSENVLFVVCVYAQQYTQQRRPLYADDTCSIHIVLLSECMVILTGGIWNCKHLRVCIFQRSYM